MALPHLAFLGVWLVLTLIFAIRALRLSRSNASIRKRVLAFQPSQAAALVEGLQFPLRTLVLSWPADAVAERLRSGLRSTELIRLHMVLPVPDREGVLLVGWFNGSEIRPARGENERLPKYYPLEVWLQPRSDGVWTAWGTFPLDRTHDFFWNELFLQVTQCLPAGPAQ